MYYTHNRPSFGDEFKAASRRYRALRRAIVEATGSVIGPIGPVYQILKILEERCYEFKSQNPLSQERPDWSYKASKIG